jgi:small-conductance mechanosensitive channel
VGFILVKVSAKLVYSIYWNIECTETILWTQQCKDTALGNPDLGATTKIIATVLQYMTWFVGIITIILIVYAWFMIVTSNWDDGKVKKWKSVIKYIIIWIVMIAASVLIFNFMLGKDLGWIVSSFK